MQGFVKKALLGMSNSETQFQVAEEPTSFSILRFQTIEGPTSASRCIILNQIIGEPDKNWWRGQTRGRSIVRLESFGKEDGDFFGGKASDKIHLKSSFAQSVIIYNGERFS